jgi:hypothetical protein
MIEALYVVSVASAICLVTLGIYMLATSSTRQQIFMKQIGATVQALKTVFYEQSDYGGYGTDLAPLLAGGFLVPKDMWQSSTQLKSAYGGTISVNALDAGGSWSSKTFSQATFVIGAFSIPSEECVGLVTMPSSAVQIATSDGSGTVRTQAAPIAPESATGPSGVCSGIVGPSIWIGFRFR